MVKLILFSGERYGSNAGRLFFLLIRQMLFE